jgi:hypothetical protein
MCKNHGAMVQHNKKKTSTCYKNSIKQKVTWYPDGHNIFYVTPSVCFPGSHDQNLYRCTMNLKW